MKAEKKKFQKVVKYHWLDEGEKTIFTLGVICVMAFITHLISFFHPGVDLLWVIIYGLFGVVCIWVAIPLREVYWEEE